MIVMCATGLLAVNACFAVYEIPVAFLLQPRGGSGLLVTLPKVITWSNLDTAGDYDVQ